MIKASPITSAVYLGVKFSNEGIANVYGARQVTFIPRHEIRRLILRYGIPGERSIIELVLGGLILLLVASQITDLIIWLAQGGVRSWFHLIIPVFLTPVGIWLVRDATQKALYLEVQTDQKTRKISFDSKPDPQLVSIMIRHATDLGYVIDTSQIPPLQ